MTSPGSGDRRIVAMKREIPASLQDIRLFPPVATNPSVLAAPEFPAKRTTSMTPEGSAEGRRRGVIFRVGRRRLAGGLRRG
jgi:hypothetical protein